MASATYSLPISCTEMNKNEEKKKEEIFLFLFYPVIKFQRIHIFPTFLINN